MGEYAFRQSVYLNGEQARRANDVLARLADEGPAVKVVALVDYRGVPLVHQVRGSVKGKGVDIRTIASLVAGQMAAMEETVRAIGERTYAEIFVPGEHLGLLILRVVPEGAAGDKKAARGTLLVIFDSQKPVGGMRQASKQAAKELAEVLLDASQNEVPDQVPDLDATQVARQLEDLFGED